MPVYGYYHDGSIQFANEAATDLFGVDDVDDVLGRSFFDFMPSDTHEVIRNRLSCLAAGEQVPAKEMEFVNFAEERRRVRICCAPTPHDERAVGQTIAQPIPQASR